MGESGQGEEKETQGNHMENIEDTEPEIWPIDVRSLVKGQTITQEECERIAGFSATHPRYPFEIMSLREFIMQESERLGTPLSIAIRGGSLVVNTDAQASDYHSRLAKMGERSIHRNFYHLAKTVDCSKLTEQERSQHDRRIAIWAMKSARLRSKALGHEETNHIGSPQGHGDAGQQEQSGKDSGGEAEREPAAR